MCIGEANLKLEKKKKCCILANAFSRQLVTEQGERKAAHA